MTQHHFFLEDRPLCRAPAGATPFERPVRRQPAAIAQLAFPGNHVGLVRLDAEPDFFADLLWQTLGDEGPDLRAKLIEFLGRHRGVV